MHIAFDFLNLLFRNIYASNPRRYRKFNSFNVIIVSYFLCFNKYILFSNISKVTIRVKIFGLKHTSFKFFPENEKNKQVYIKKYKSIL